VNTLTLPTLRYHKLYDDVHDLNFATGQSACFDIRAYVPNGIPKLAPGERMLIPTGLVFDIPEGWSMRIHIRSGIAIKRGLTLINAEGIIDSDYVHELLLPVINHHGTFVGVEHNERIAQAELVQQPLFILEEAPDPPEQKTDRKGGFGSTGTQ
jgi:dUTP pyrophosphatase